MDKSCPVCHTIISEQWNFCSQCGVNFKKAALSTSTGKQILIYFVSFFLAPFGLHYAIKYIRQSESKAKIIGVVSLILTIAAITLMFLITNSFMNAFYNPVSLGF